jgi:hypothetical protein
LILSDKVGHREKVVVIEYSAVEKMMLDSFVLAPPTQRFRVDLAAVVAYSVHEEPCSLIPLQDGLGGPGPMLRGLREDVVQSALGPESTVENALLLKLCFQCTHRTRTAPQLL